MSSLMTVTCDVCGACQKFDGVTSVHEAREFLGSIGWTYEGMDYCRACSPLPGVDTLAQLIRRVDGKHDLGAGALAEALLGTGQVTIKEA